MTQGDVTSLLNEFLQLLGQGDLAAGISDPYSALMKLTEKWPKEFTASMGYEDALSSLEEAQQSVNGIVAITPSYPLYPYQSTMVAKVQDLMNRQQRRCLLHLPTGAGKTRTAMNIASEHLRDNPKGLVLWLADTSELCAQASEEFVKAWSSLGDRELKLYSYYSDTNISLGGIDNGFLVAGLQKLNAARGSDEYKVLYEQLRKHVSLIIFDEAHKAIAPTYAKTATDMLSINESAFLLGLSATPGRTLDFSNDEDARLTEFFKSNKVTMAVSGYESPIKYLVEQGYLAKAEFININYDGGKIVLADQLSNKKMSQEIRGVLSESDERNSELLRVITKEYSAGGSIIVFACSVEHSRSLAAMLAFSGIPAYSLDSKNDDSETRRFKISEYSAGRVRVLVNYSILTAGFDVPRTNVSIIARPTDSLVQYSQMAGRAMRGIRSKGNEHCKIYTVRDDIPSFTSVVAAFTHWDNLWSKI
jgi:superfamily II DNA or RNA helicase